MADENMAGILRRVQKLLAMANDSRANPNEAAAAGEQAEKIMRKFQLDHADVIKAEIRAGGAAMEESVVFANMKRDDPKRPPAPKNPPWGQQLAVAIAKLTDTQVRQAFANNKFGVRGAALKFQGYGPDVQLAAWMFDYLVGAVIAGCKNFNETRRKDGNADKVASNSYRSGFILTLIQRIYDQTAAKAAEQKALTVTGTALIVVKQQAIAEHFGGVQYVTKRSNASFNSDAYGAGRRDGRNVDIARRGVTGQSETRRLA